MPLPDHVIGIIAIDADPCTGPLSDETLGQTLVSLQHPSPHGETAASQMRPSRRWHSEVADESRVLRADLGQLACDLESEYRRVKSAIPLAGLSSLYH
jgi:hypothetical protein